MILLASVCYGDSRVGEHFLNRHLVFQPILPLSTFLNQIPHQNEPEISVGIFSSQPLLTTATASLI
jgi:hypothetical protein